MQQRVKRAPGHATSAAGDVRVLARGGVLSLVGVVCGTLLQLVAFLIVTRGLSTIAAGVLFTSVALFMIVTNCTVLGADAALVRQVAARRATGRLNDLRPTLKIGRASCRGRV